MHEQAPPELALGPARIAQEATSWLPVLDLAKGPDMLAFAGTCLKPPVAGSLRTLGALGQALVKAVGSCAVAGGSCAAAGDAEVALLLLGTLCEHLAPDPRVSL